jgi:hypothetical protein
VVPLGEEAPASSEASVQVARDPDRQPLHAAREGSLILGLADEVQVVALHGEVREPEAEAIFAARERLAEDAEAVAPTESSRRTLSVTWMGKRAARSGLVRCPLRAPGSLTERAILARMADLEKLARELGGASVAGEVALAASDPARYRKKYAKRLADVVADVRARDLPLVALVEALAARGVLAEVDWKEAASEVLGWLEEIGGAAGRRALKAAHEWWLDDRPTDEALVFFARLLEKDRLALVQIDKDSDSFALMIVPAARVAKLERLGGARIVLHPGDSLEKLEAARARREMKKRSTNRWGTLCDRFEHSRGNETKAENVLFELNFDRKLLGEIKDALSHVPKRDRPLVEMTIALHEGDAAAIARKTREPELCLRALEYLKSKPKVEGVLAAVAILARRLGVRPEDRDRRHVLVCEASNLWETRTADASLALLPRADRALLARLADGMLERMTEVSPRWDTGFNAMNTVGDEASLPILAALGEKTLASWRRLDYELPPANETVWAIAARRIRARARKM